MDTPEATTHSSPAQGRTSTTNLSPVLQEGRSMKLADTVVTMPNSPAVAILRYFHVSIFEHTVMLACLDGLKPSDCTPAQSRALQHLESLCYVRMSNRRGLWVIDDLGETVLDLIALRMRRQTTWPAKAQLGQLITAKVLSFPSGSARGDSDVARHFGD